MSTAFSRSTRSLDADNSAHSVFGLILIVAILGAWIAWFLLARVSVYEVTNTARLHSKIKIVAEFPPSTLGRIRPGQPAELRLDGFPWTKYGTVSASVTSVRSNISEGSVVVEFVVHPDATSRIPLQRGLQGILEVEVDRVSPAELVISATGQRLGGMASGREVRP